MAHRLCLTFTAVLIAMALSELGCFMSDGCTNEGCPSGADIAVILSPDADVSGASITLCRNQRCSVARITGGGQRFTLEGEVVGSVNVEPEPGRLLIDVELAQSHPQTGVLEDGDLYSVTMRSADGMVLANAEWIAEYQESYPNGKDCDHVPCMHMEFETQGL